MWLAIVLFAPFGIFIYFFIGRRLKPVSHGSRPEKESATAPARSGNPSESAPHRRISWPSLTSFAITALLCVVIYINVVSLFGTEKTGWILISAMIIVGMILAFLQFGRSRGK
jgi:hypothetical protein